LFDLNGSDATNEATGTVDQHACKVLTHRFLLGELREETADPQYLRVYVQHLRQKIESDQSRPQYLLTETGIGYRLRAAQVEPA
jgi:two-component system KDP operon response regulator KdpE